MTIYPTQLLFQIYSYIPSYKVLVAGDVTSYITVKSHLAATSLIRPPRYSGHL